MYLSTDAVTSIKRRANVPTAQTTFENSDFYSLIDEELRAKLLPLILSNMEEYYVRSKDYALTEGQSKYLIPTRAIAAALRDVEIVSDDDDQSRTPLQRIAREELTTALAGSSGIVIRKKGFYPEGNSVVVYPTPVSTQNILRLSYYCRPNAIVATTACAQVQSIDTTLKQITVASLPSTFSTATPLDFVKANPHFECSAIDQTPSDVAGTVLTFTDALPSDLAVGDYLCLAGESCVIQVPVELQPLLMQYAVVRVLSAQTDTEALRNAIAELEKLEKNATLLIAPRVAGKAKRVTNGRGLSRFV